MKKAIFLDIDGTLIDGPNGILAIQPAVEEALHQLQAAGHEVWIATGRPFAFLPPSIRQFGFDGFVLANGAHVMHKGETIHSVALAHQFVTELVDFLDQHQIQYVLEGPIYSYLRKEHTDMLGFYEKLNTSMEYFRFDPPTLEESIHKIELFCPSEAVFDQCAAWLSDHPAYDYFTSINKIYMELYFKENTKAVGIERALKEIDIPISRSYAFGDGENDIQMLQVVGCGIAMGNATDYVKSHANLVTDTIAADGVAKGIKDFILTKNISLDTCL